VYTQHVCNLCVYAQPMCLVCLCLCLFVRICVCVDVHVCLCICVCTVCERWLRSKGGLAVHKCIERNLHNLNMFKYQQWIHCFACERCFNQSSDLKRHKCLSERSFPIKLQHGAIWCPICHRWFHRKSGIAVHRVLTSQGDVLSFFMQYNCTTV